MREANRFPEHLGLPYIQRQMDTILENNLVDTATTSQGREARMMECEKSRMLFLYV